MKELINQHITTYDMGKKWRVDIVHKANEQEAWIYREDYGTKELMFGCANTERDFYDLVRANFIQYKVSYWEDYIADEEDWENQ